MNTKTHNVQWVVESATVLIIIGVGLNVVVTQTLGAFSAASVILGLYLGFWAFVLGSMVLIFSSIWVFMRRPVLATSPRQSDGKRCLR